jgi:hypothetical protein
MSLKTFHSVSVADQEFRISVHEESVVLYNDVIFKCNIQSHVTDFVTVTGWVSSEGQDYGRDTNYGKSSRDLSHSVE